MLTYAMQYDKVLQGSDYSQPLLSSSMHTYIACAAPRAHLLSPYSDASAGRWPVCERETQTDTDRERERERKREREYCSNVCPEKISI